MNTITSFIDQHTNATVFSSENYCDIPINYLELNSIVVSQTHKIRLFRKGALRPVFKIMADEKDTEVKIILHKGYRCKNVENMQKTLYNEINKKLARFKYILYIFESDLKSQIEEYASLCLRDAIQENYVFFAAKAYAYKEPKNDALDLLFSSKDKNASKINFYDRDFAKEVDADEILAIYYGPIIGSSGRSCKGAYLSVANPEIKYANLFECDCGVEIIYDDNIIKYVSKKHGFVQLIDKKLKVSDTINLERINTRETGSMSASKVGAITVNVTEDNPALDAIGPNIIIRVYDLVVSGSVAEMAQIFAHNLHIMGSTHASSMLEIVNEATIKNHKGFLKTKVAVIEHLEGGEINCEMASVKIVKGGIIRAKKVFIDRIDSNCKIFASELINIKEIIGFGVELCIDTNARGDYDERKNDAIKQIELAKLGLDQKYESFKKLSAEVRALEPVIKTIKAIPGELAFSLKDIIQKYKTIISKANCVKNEIGQKRAEICDFEKEYAKLCEEVLTANLIIDSIKGVVKIKFIAPDMEGYEFAQGSHRALNLSLKKDDKFYWISTT